MANLKVPVGEQDHARGPLHAEVTLVEYGDYECPFCGEAYPIVKEVQERLGDRLRFVFRNFPLGELHPHAVVAAETAEFAAANDEFWAMHDLLFENQRDFGPERFRALVEELKLSPELWAQALEKGTYDARVRDDFRGGVRSGVNGTPTFYMNGRRHDGPYALESLLAAIERAAAGVTEPEVSHEHPKRSGIVRS